MHILTIFAIAILLSTTQQNTKDNDAIIGMDYYLVPNKQTPCADDFGDGLSFFFEQVGGYGETAEVEQISNILNIDLSLFQDVDYDTEDSSEAEKHRHELQRFSCLVDAFIYRINAHPDYHKQVNHNPERNKQLAEEERIWQITDSTEREK